MKHVEEISYLNLNNVTEASVIDGFLIVTFLNNSQCMYDSKKEPLRVDFIKSNLARKFLVVRKEEFYVKAKI